METSRVAKGYLLERGSWLAQGKIDEHVHGYPYSMFDHLPYGISIILYVISDPRERRIGRLRLLKRSSCAAPHFLSRYRSPGPRAGIQPPPPIDLYLVDHLNRLVLETIARGVWRICGPSADDAIARDIFAPGVSSGPFCEPLCSSASASRYALLVGVLAVRYAYTRFHSSGSGEVQRSAPNIPIR